MVLISVDDLWNYEYGSDLAVFPALVIFPTSNLRDMQIFSYT
jgi:hypothetical protein